MSQTVYLFRWLWPDASVSRMAYRTGDHVLEALLKMHPCLFICFYFNTSLQFHMLFVIWGFCHPLHCSYSVSLCSPFVSLSQPGWRNFSVANFKWQSSRIMSQRSPQQCWISEAQRKREFWKTEQRVRSKESEPKIHLREQGALTVFWGRFEVKGEPRTSEK